MKYAWKKATITVATSTTISDAVSILGYGIVGIIVPTGWDAATVNFTIDPGDGTFRAVTGFTAITVVANQITPLDLTTNLIITGASVKLVASQAQQADRAIIVLLQKL